MIKSIPAGPDKDYLRDNLQDAKWFLKSLQTRHDTLLKVATKIVEVQKDFLELGPEAMKPLILADIAEQVTSMSPQYLGNQSQILGDTTWFVRTEILLLFTRGHCRRRRGIQHSNSSVNPQGYRGREPPQTVE